MHKYITGSRPAFYLSFLPSSLLSFLQNTTFLQFDVRGACIRRENSTDLFFPILYFPSSKILLIYKKCHDNHNSRSAIHERVKRSCIFPCPAYTHNKCEIFFRHVSVKPDMKTNSFFFTEQSSSNQRAITRKRKKKRSEGRRA